jgi:hypothetical protein
VPVTLLDPASGTTKELLGPKYNDPEAEAFWKPVADGIRERMKKRGLEEALMLGILSDSIPREHVVQLWKQILPDAPWTCMAHGGENEIYGVPVKYRTMVHHFKWPIDPGIERIHGWARPHSISLFPRSGTMGGDAGAYKPLVFFRMLFEWNIQGNQRGAGRLAGDFFRTKVGHGGRRISNRYGESSWRNLNLCPPWLAPGKNGAASTVQFDMAREGIQECEAFIYIDNALMDPKLRAKLGEPLAKKCRAILDERIRYNLWGYDMGANWRRQLFLPGGGLGSDWYACGSRWQDRSRALYDAAGEVQDKLQ